MKCDVCKKDCSTIISHYDDSLNTNVNYCLDCYKLTFRESPIKEEKSSDLIYNQYGWICPKCGSIYAPNHPNCWICNSNNYKTTFDNNTTNKFTLD
jgi:methionyl-tRNA synthetase